MSDRLERWRDAVRAWHNHICTCGNPVTCLQSCASGGGGDGGGQDTTGGEDGDGPLAALLDAIEKENGTKENQDTDGTR